MPLVALWTNDPGRIAGAFSAHDPTTGPQTAGAPEIRRWSHDPLRKAGARTTHDPTRPQAVSLSLGARLPIAAGGMIVRAGPVPVESRLGVIAPIVGNWIAAGGGAPWPPPWRRPAWALVIAGEACVALDVGADALFEPAPAPLLRRAPLLPPAVARRAARPIPWAISVSATPARIALAPGAAVAVDRDWRLTARDDDDLLAVFAALDAL